MKDTIDDMLKVIGDRLRSRFIWSLFISFIVINWRPLVYLILSDQDVLDRITYINDNFNDPIWTMLIPVLLALAYTFLMPYFETFIEKKIHKAGLGRDKVAHDRRIERLKQERTAAALQREVDLAKTDNIEREELNRRIEQSKVDIVELQQALIEKEEEAVKVFEQNRKDKEMLQGELKNMGAMNMNSTLDMNKLQQRLDALQRENMRLKKVSMIFIHILREGSNYYFEATNNEGALYYRGAKTYPSYNMCMVDVEQSMLNANLTKMVMVTNRHASKSQTHTFHIMNDIDEVIAKGGAYPTTEARLEVMQFLDLYAPMAQIKKSASITNL